MERVRSQPFVVVRAFIENDGKFLLVQENWGEVKGMWNFPAGWLDLGENPLAGAIREAKEESGYDFTPDYLLGIYSFIKTKDGQPNQPVEIVYRGSVSGEQAAVDSEEISAVRWFTPEEIMAMDTKTLRDEISKEMLKDHLSGRKYPLDTIKYTP